MHPRLTLVHSSHGSSSTLWFPTTTEVEAILRRWEHTLLAGSIGKVAQREFQRGKYSRRGGLQLYSGGNGIRCCSYQALDWPGRAHTRGEQQWNGNSTIASRGQNKWRRTYFSDGLLCMDKLLKPREVCWDSINKNLKRLRNLLR